MLFTKELVDERKVNLEKVLTGLSEEQESSLEELSIITIRVYMISPNRF